MTAKIYDYDEASGELYEELSQFPMLTFYDNATIGAGISHNQGYAGEFWPYTFYTYDAANDSYRAEYFVDAWDKSLSDVNYNGEAFPDDADKDGDGIVYYLDAPDGSETGEPLDRDAFDQLISENVGNEENIPFQDLTEDAIRLRDHSPEELSHYSKGTTDIEYKFPFGWGELWGIADRTDYDLTCHQNTSGEDMTYYDQSMNEKYVPYCIEPSVGADRVSLAFLCDAYNEEEVGEGDVRTVLKFHPALAPIKAAVLPLS